jgi:ATP-binding cassette subfamily B protein
MKKPKSSKWMLRGGSPQLAGIRNLAKSHPFLTLLTAILIIISGALPAAFIIETARLVWLVSTESRPTRGSILAPIIALGLIALVGQLTAVIRQALAEALGRRMDFEFRDRLMRAVIFPNGISHLENDESLGRISAAKGVMNRLSGPAGGLLGLVGQSSNLVTAFSMLALIGYGSIWAAILMLSCALVTATWLRSRLGLATLEINLDGGQLRRVQYLRDLMLTSGVEKEVMVFGLSDFVGNAHRKAWKEAASIAWRGLPRRHTVLSISVLFASGEVATILLLSLRSKFLTFGFLVALQGAIAMIPIVLVSEWDRLAKIGWSAVARLIEVEGLLNPSIVSRTERKSQFQSSHHNFDPDHLEPITFKDVRFAYPNAKEEVLRGVSLVIEPGVTSAIVGMNGAGKSTLIALLARLHEPIAGEIYYGEIDIRDIPIAVWREKLSAVFQSSSRLSLTLEENIRWGAPRSEATSDDLLRVIRQADLEELSGQLPQGLSTLLGKGMAGGVDLSTGEWQKIALARGLYAVHHGASILALDEPTASMDIEAERRVYERAISGMSGTTVILISHRFPTVRRAARIFVLNDGVIEESGSHESLIRVNGLYSSMFTMQASLLG